VLSAFLWCRGATRGVRSAVRRLFFTMWSQSCCYGANCALYLGVVQQWWISRLERRATGSRNLRAHTEAHHTDTHSPSHAHTDAVPHTPAHTQSYAFSNPTPDTYTDAVANAGANTCPISPTDSSTHTLAYSTPDTCADSFTHEEAHTETDTLPNPHANASADICAELQISEEESIQDKGEWRHDCKEHPSSM